MAKLRHLFQPVTVAEEREFERDNVSRKLERYLQTNPLDRFERDAPYRLKVERIRKGLEKQPGRLIEGLVLDLGVSSSSAQARFAAELAREVCLRLREAFGVELREQPPRLPEDRLHDRGVDHATVDEQLTDLPAHGRPPRQVARRRGADSTGAGGALSRNPAGSAPGRFALTSPGPSSIFPRLSVSATSAPCLRSAR